MTGVFGSNGVDRDALVGILVTALSLIGIWMTFGTAAFLRCFGVWGEQPPRAVTFLVKIIGIINVLGGIYLFVMRYLFGHGWLGRSGI